jgi:hypothetical protein
MSTPPNLVLLFIVAHIYQSRYCRTFSQFVCPELRMCAEP